MKVQYERGKSGEKDIKMGMVVGVKEWVIIFLLFVCFSSVSFCAFGTLKGRETERDKMRERDETREREVNLVLKIT